MKKGKEKEKVEMIPELLTVLSRCFVLGRINPDYKFGEGKRFEVTPGKKIRLTKSEVDYILNETTLFETGVLFPVSNKEMDLMLDIKSLEKYPLAFSDVYLDSELKGSNGIEFIKFLKKNKADERVLTYVRDRVGTEEVKKNASGTFILEFEKFYKKELYSLKEDN